MIDTVDYQLIAAVQAGLPIAARPYALIAEKLAIAEQEVIERLAGLKARGLIKRWGVVVKHRQLGYRANAMIVMNVPDARVGEIGALISRQACVNLCYQRPRQGEVWPYNLYCMIHGKSREVVLEQWAELRHVCNLSDYPFELLFSRRCFKQRGALYARHIANRKPAGFRHANGLNMDALDKTIINRLQQGFPICDSPYRRVADELGIPEADLLNRLQSMLADGVLSRFGPMYHAEQMGGALTLAAIKVPDQRFDEVTGIVNGFPEVAHNYARNHPLNMWFVLATEQPEQVATVLAEIERLTGLTVYNMPKISEYYVGLQLAV